MRKQIMLLFCSCILAGCGTTADSSQSRTPSPSPVSRLRVPTPVGGNTAGVAPISTRTPIPTSQYTAMLKGTVTDTKKNSPLAGALVSVNNGAKTARTNAFGEYSIAFPAGAAVPVLVTFGGYTEGLGMGVLKAHRTARVNFKLDRVVPGRPPIPPAPLSFGTP